MGKIVISGDCAIDGGVYKGSYAANDGAARYNQVDLIIPGCPPKLADIASVLVCLIETIRQKKS